MMNRRMIIDKSHTRGKFPISVLRADHRAFWALVVKATFRPTDHLYGDRMVSGLGRNGRGAYLLVEGESRSTGF